KLGEGYFTFKSLGPTLVKGVSEPIEVYEVTGLGPLRTRLQRAAARGLTKFVGREREMEALRHSAELALTGHGQMVAVIAEPGVGKSRLFHEFKATEGGAERASMAGRDACSTNWMTLEALSVSHGKASAYLPVLELLRDYFRIAATDDLRTRREKVTDRIVALDRSLADTLPYLFGLMGLSEGDDPLAQMDAQLRRRRTHEALKRILLRESLNQPLMVIFEDLHWIDGETQALLNLLIDAIGTARILLLVNYRPEYRHEWSSRTHYTQLRLDPLGRESAKEMLDALLSTSAAPLSKPFARLDTLPLARSFAGEGSASGMGADLTALKRLIIERTEGNPFFMEETVQVLLDDGALVRNGEVELTRPLRDLKIPLTVQAMLSARFDRLPPPEKELLQILAVIGKEHALELIQAVTGKREEQLEPLLMNLQLGEFIYEQPRIAGPEYTFKHALTQEVAYKSLLAEGRRMIHEQIGRSMEQLYSQQLEDHSSELTYHYLRGIDAAKAAHYARLAAQLAVSRAAYAEATSIIEAALNVLDRIPDNDERIRSELALRNVEWGLAYVRYGGSSPEIERLAQRMIELGEELGPGDELLRGLQALGRLYFSRGEPVRGLVPVRRCMQLAEARQDAQLLAEVRDVMGGLALLSGNLRDAVSQFEDVLHYVEQVNPYFRIGAFIGRVIYPAMLSMPMQALGLVGEAGKMADEGLMRARESKQLFNLGFALIIAGGIFRVFRREPTITIAQSEEAIALSKEGGFTNWLTDGQFYHGWALSELGQLDKGIAEMEEGIAGIRGSGGSPFTQYAIALLAHVYARTGQTKQGLRMLNDALMHIEQTGEKFEQAELLRLKGEVLLMCDPAAHAAAESCFREAFGVARAQEAKWWELRTSVSLARLLRDTNRSDEARSILAGICNWFTEGFDLADLKEAKALLDELRS
ncbi:MAG: AAA family ATPase, partial [Deltaproteobacteria bacterium]|nr:AAA family ATPase [Deltaproteobacteria bacterium]